jgi:hypothetical protein
MQCFRRIIVTENEVLFVKILHLTCTKQIYIPLNFVQELHAIPVQYSDGDSQVLNTFSPPASCLNLKSQPLKSKHQIIKIKRINITRCFVLVNSLPVTLCLAHKTSTPSSNPSSRGVSSSHPSKVESDWQRPATTPSKRGRSTFVNTPYMGMGNETDEFKELKLKKNYPRNCIIKPNILNLLRQFFIQYLKPSRNLLQI